MKKIGIDPAFRKGGFWVCEIEGNEVVFKQMAAFIDFIKYIAEIEKTAKVMVENSNLDNVSFLTFANKNVAAKISRNAGTNQAVSQITVDLCRYFGLETEEIAPSKKGAKWTDEQFKLVVKQNKHVLHNYKGLKGEQDKRDAYKMALMV